MDDLFRSDAPPWGSDGVGIQSLGELNANHWRVCLNIQPINVLFQQAFVDPSQ